MVGRGVGGGAAVSWGAWKAMNDGEAVDCDARELHPAHDRRHPRGDLPLNPLIDLLLARVFPANLERVIAVGDYVQRWGWVHGTDRRRELVGRAERVAASLDE